MCWPEDFTSAGNKMLIDGEKVNFFDSPVDTTYCLQQYEVGFISRLAYRVTRRAR